jgi:hypothetical protein
VFFELRVVLGILIYNTHHGVESVDVFDPQTLAIRFRLARLRGVDSGVGFLGSVLELLCSVGGVEASHEREKAVVEVALDNQIICNLVMLP